MTIAADDLGVLGNLGKALGVFNSGGGANPDWFGNPQDSLKTMLAETGQRDALMAFVDEALGGEERQTDASGVVWLPIMNLRDADIPDIDISVTIDDSGTSICLGLGVEVSTDDPEAHLRASVPLFKVTKAGGPEVTDHLLLGKPGARIAISTSIVITPPGTTAAGTAAQPSIGAIGLEVSLPTALSDPEEPVFGLSLERLQLPGATTPRDLRFAADGTDELDDAVLDLVLSLVRAQADAAGGVQPRLGALAGLLGLVSGDDVEDFPITELPTSGVRALASWVRTIMTTTDARTDWLGYLAGLLGGNRIGDTVAFTLGGDAELSIGVRVDTGPSGNPRLTPSLAVDLGGDDARVEARADLLSVDLVTGSAVALPSFGVWAAAGRGTAGHRVIDLTAPTVVRADTLRVGFGLDALRRAGFVLAADNVLLGTHPYAVLDLTSPDAVMDAVGNTVGEVADSLIEGLAPADELVRLLLGITPPGGIAAVTLPALLADPLGAVTTYWQAVLGRQAAAQEVLTALREAISDTTVAASGIEGDGTPGDPWRMPLVGPLHLQVSLADDVASIGLAATTTVDTLGAGCTVVDTRFAATLAEIDLGDRTASLLPEVAATLTAHEADVTPARVRLQLSEQASVTADRVGLRLGWTPSAGLAADLVAPRLSLHLGDTDIPVVLPQIAPDGTVTLPADGWDAVERFVGYLGDLVGGVVGDLVRLLGWTTTVPQAGGDAPSTGARLRLAELVTDARAALLGWLPALAVSSLAPALLDLVADLLQGAGPVRGLVQGSGHPDDPYRLPLGNGLPTPAVWFPPEGLEPRRVAAPEAIQSWRPGDPALPPGALATALSAEAGVAADIRALVEGRDVTAGLTALAGRWVGGDGRIVPPTAAPAGVEVVTDAVAAGQLFDELELADLLGRAPDTTVYVALGSSAWAEAPAGRRVDLSTPGLTADMFAVPAGAAGEWFVALGTRQACRGPSSTTDGTPEQAARLRRLIQNLAGVSSDIVLVGVAAAGHAARLVAQSEPAVTGLVTVGTPWSPIALTALNTQPTADALRLLHRLLPPEPAQGPDVVGEDDDLALGRALVGAMMELSPLADPSVDLRTPAAPPGAPRPGLEVVALFGQVSEQQVGRAMTAIVAAGLAARARIRAAAPLARPTGIQAGLVLAVPDSTAGALAVTGDARLTLASYDFTATDPADALDTTPWLRARLRVGDRNGWLVAAPDVELRAGSADVSIPLGGSGPGTATLTLHDGRVFGQSWEALVLGTGPGAVPVLPEARSLLAVLVQRLTVEAASTASTAVADLMRALALISPTGGLAGDALDQLVHDPGGLVRSRLAVARNDLATALTRLLGPVAAGLDLDTRTLTVTAGSDTTGRFGWSLRLSVAPGGVTGRLLFGPSSPSASTGGLQFEVALAPLRVQALWYSPLPSTGSGSGGSGSAGSGSGPAGSGPLVITLWPDPDASVIARALAAAAPSLGGHVAIELMRRLDPTTKPIIDAALDALGLLAGQASDAERALRPLAGLIANPAGWLRGPDSLAANPAKTQRLFDAIRPLVGVGGSPGSPLSLADGVTLAVTAAGSAARMELAVDAGAWTAPAGAAARLTAGATAALTVAAAGPPVVDLELFIGMTTGTEPGRQAVHARLGTGGIQVFLRPATGADISLLPFAGLGSLAAAAEAALPFLLDQLAALPAPVGPLVATIGDALALRTAPPAHFDGTRLHDWAQDPTGQLALAAGSIASTGLTALAPLVDAYLPASITASAPTPNTLRVVIGDVALTWTPSTGAVVISLDELAVPGVEQVSGTVAVGPTGLQQLSLTVGPAEINTGSVTLRPFVTVAAGTSPAGGRRIVVGTAVDADSRFGARWLLDTHSFALVTSDGLPSLPTESDDPGAVALRLVEVVADVVAAVALRTDAVTEVLDSAVGATTVRNLLRGVLLTDVADSHQLIPGLFDLATVLARVQKLAVNLGSAGLSVTIEGLTLTLLTLGDEIGLQLGVEPRWALVEGDVSLWLETDDSWINPDPPGSGGVFLGVLSAAAPLTFRPSLTINGVGLRVGSANGPLVDSVITIESIALHTYAAVDLTGVRGGGAQVQFSNLAVAPSGGGSNGIAQGVMRDTGPTPPRPAFSPALAIQQHGTDPVEVTLRAGDGDGPWWIAIRRGFGPLYLEQIGFGVGVANHRIQRVSLLMDGSLSMFGLTCAVDDLQITYLIDHGDFLNPNSWVIDLAGLAISADMAGLTIAGGLLKQTTPAGIEYLGMLLARFGTYGITIYGGYGEGVDNGIKFTAFFAVGAINGPIGGPPAFFLTGIGGGFGINRQLKVPTDLSRFGDYPLIQALDIAARPTEPMAQLRALGAYYPMKRGTFWFAAGISFNSFALVDGIAVLAVQIGDGLDINLLGLARMALPRPQAAIISIELALLVRFSSSEGVLWVQAQLTDNSWLLYPDVRLTGGFAFVIWFKGQHRGECVLTLGGYHPDFHRDGYPVVPRLGLHWAIGDNIVIEAGSYFALTSEAVMAGGDFHASAHFGPAWADLRFGAHGIIYFDPFRYQVNAYVRISAGITIDTWLFGEITISVSLGARIDIAGPQFHGVATFEVGPAGLSVPFGDSEQTRKELLGAAQFIEKYLDATPAGALAHAAMVAQGALPAKGENSTPDGSGSRPFVVVCEFAMTFATTVPAVEVNRVNAAGTALTTHNPSRALGVAPMGAPSVRPRLNLTWQRGNTPVAFPFVVGVRAFGAFPVGVWGPPQPDDNRKVPKADMIEALNELDLTATATPSGGGPTIPYHQVEIGVRKPLPFTRRASQVNAFKNETSALAALISEPATVDEAFGLASRFLSATATPTGLAALRGERQAPPRLGTLGEGLQATAATVVPDVGSQPAPKVYDHFVDAPIAVGLLPGTTVDLRSATSGRTTVKDAPRLWQQQPPTLASVEESRSRSIAARLVMTEPNAVSTGRRGTLIGADRVPVTAIAHGPAAVVRRAGGAGTEHLDGFSAALTAGRRTGRGTAGAVLSAGETVVLRLPNAAADAGDGDRPQLQLNGDPARVVILAAGGQVMLDQVLTGDQTVEIARGAERIVAIGQGRPADLPSQASPGEVGLAGWHAGAQLPYAGWSTALGPGCVLRSNGDPLRRNGERVDAGWVVGAELAKGLSTVTTSFAEPVRSVVIILDDPAALGDPVAGRGLLLGLDGAVRAVGADGQDLPPVLLAAENRSVLAYDIVPDGDRAVVVTIASELGWSLVGVMAAADSAAAAIAMITTKGLDAALRPLATGSAGSTRLAWLGATRNIRERQRAKALAAGRPAAERVPRPSRERGRRRR